jgi:hypothetical protein
MNWLRYFEYNREHRLPVQWETSIDVPPSLRPLLVRSLQRFQLGESGEGRHLRRQAATTGDAAYQASIDLFIKEEQEHARLMAGVLRRMTAPLISFHWSDACFIALRRLFDLRTELLVLLVPEMIARHYFGALRGGFSNPVLRTVFSQILHDEEGHLAFHADHLNRAVEPWSFLRRVLVQLLWRFVYRAACLAVWLDHGALLRGVGISSGAFWRETGAIFDEVAAKIFSPAHVLCPPRLAANVP